MEMTGAGEFPAVTKPNYDRFEDLKAFDETKAGVKGLVDAGVVKLPRIFIRPPDELALEKLNSHIQTHFEVPVIDLAGIDRDDRRKEIVDEIGRASERWGFFQVVNHGVPVTVMEEMIKGVVRFNEQDDEVKKELYTRDRTRRVRFISNFDLYITKTANWKDTLTIAMLSPDFLGPEALPAVCRMEMTGAGEFPAVTKPNYDRFEDLKAFDETKAGVKGLVDAGVVKLPRIFIRPPDELALEKLNSHIQTHFEVPVIDLAGIDRDDRRKEIVDEIGRASERWGFFQVVNHGVPVTVMEEMIKGVVRFNEQDDEVKKELYTRDRTRRVRFISNFDLYITKTANWKDTLTIAMLSPDFLGPEALPAVCRKAKMEYTKRVMPLGDTLFELLSEALGLKLDHLKGMDCAKGCSLTCQYYPACPEPELVLGTSKHSDPVFLNVLLQDHIGGLQVLHQDQWVNVHPIPGALVVNIGDLLQVCFNNNIFYCDML
ncbi:hypothetical protein HHK36_020501 [Tetracentron sinense]|uniref:Fe2OG dioxygenase domain-containing protein n=1 Tax=Tetracentron sinense TaxID=13715 RepID=A0A834YU52_TETSI|nr:hypothetical protein HHK36_020501 [Tetracentron sinense]